ncbi:MAG: hypothetical protein HQL60_06660 [Magnetococcales bacterium]|nr:hypothetical protein [Magnetococcales bacterium]
MNAKSDGLKSNLKQVDDHVITQEEYEEIPELPAELFAEGTLYHDGKPIVSKAVPPVFERKPRTPHVAVS